MYFLFSILFIGISKHTRMVVISYSAEGASFIDREAYPYFFRTIGSNRQYEAVYLNLFQQLKWRRIAALTEDGQKYTEYISHMETLLKQNDMELIVNKKFPKEITTSEMRRVSFIILFCFLFCFKTNSIFISNFYFIF